MSWIPLFFRIFNASAIQSIEADSKVKRTKVKSNSDTFYNSSLIYWPLEEGPPPNKNAVRCPCTPCSSLASEGDCVISKLVISKLVPPFQNLNKQVLLQRGPGFPPTGVQI